MKDSKLENLANGQERCFPLCQTKPTGQRSVGIPEENGTTGTPNRNGSYYKFVNSALDNLLVSGSEIFINFSIKRGVG